MKKTLINTVVVPYLRGIDTFSCLNLTFAQNLLIVSPVVPYLRGIDTFFLLSKNHILLPYH